MADLERRRALRTGLLGLGGLVLGLAAAPLDAAARSWRRHDERHERHERHERRRRWRHRRHRRRERRYRHFVYHCRPCGLYCSSRYHLFSHVFHVHHVPWWRIERVLRWTEKGLYFYG